MKHQQVVNMRSLLKYQQYHSAFFFETTPIGKGAFGSVYACRKHFGKKKYAAKVVEHGDDNKIKWQTENEIEVRQCVNKISSIILKR